MNKILLLGAGKSSTCLIDYLNKSAVSKGWQFTVADSNLELVQSKLKGAANSRAKSLNVLMEAERGALIEEADIVISLLPPALHILAARDCLTHGKHLLTASYADEALRKMGKEAEAKGICFFCEMGLDPGIDHMSAVRLIEACRAKGWQIRSFKSHTGGLVAPESDDNPWHYKISWNPRNVVRAGAAGAVFKEENQVRHLNYQSVFEQCELVEFHDLGFFAAYPNRDSMSYISLYGLEEAATFIRTTLRRPGFCENWLTLVKAGLTDDQQEVQPSGLMLRDWSKPVLAYLQEGQTEVLRYLGLFENAPVPRSAKTSADILQWLLETRLIMKPEDRDLIVMKHELQCTEGNKTHLVESNLVVKGEDATRTAMAKTVGLPLGIAASLMLEGKLYIPGVHIPTNPKIYLPVLAELEANEIRFTESEKVLVS